MLCGAPERHPEDNAVTENLPVVTLNQGASKRAEYGHPWVFSNEIRMDPATKGLAPGTIVRIVTDNSAPLGVAMFNPHSLIAARFLSRDPKAVIDRTFLEGRIASALALRERLYDAPCYRLVHAEADGLPGVAIDRYGHIVVAQINSAGIDRLADDLAEALMTVVGARTVVLRGDSPIRKLEGLPEAVRVVGAPLSGEVEVHENGIAYRADLALGQKTGWYFDQRDNRAFMGRLAQGARVLDVYSHGGGFGLACAVAGATSVTLVDRSEPALALAGRAAEANKVDDRVRIHVAEAFEDLAKRRDRGDTYDVVICDPPAFVKSKKDLAVGVKGYRKLARLAARLVAPGGYLGIASCSHHVDPDAFLAQVARGVHDTGRQAAILRRAGAGSDHPVHPQLPESAYLKFLALRLDPGA